MGGVARWEVTRNANGLGFSDGIRQSPHGNFVSLDDYNDLLEALEQLLPQNLGPLPEGQPDSLTVPVDMTFGEIRRARAAIARAKGEA